MTDSKMPSADTSTHALLWSQSQCAMHIEPIADMLSSNRQAYTVDQRMDYVPIYFGSADECHQASASVRATMRQRQAARAEHESI